MDGPFRRVNGLSRRSFMKSVRGREIAVEVYVGVGEVEVSGRKYKVSHIIIFGQSETFMELKPYDININAVFDDLPYIRHVQDELVVLKSESDMKLIEHAQNIIKCDIDRKIVTKIDDKVYVLKCVKLYTKKPIIINAMILWPLMVSILSVERVSKIDVKLREDVMIIEL